MSSLKLIKIYSVKLSIDPGNNKAFSREGVNPLDARNKLLKSICRIFFTNFYLYNFCLFVILIFIINKIMIIFAILVITYFVNDI